MAEILPPELTQRLATAWPHLSAPARALLLWLVDGATTSNAELDARTQKLTALWLEEAQASAPNRAPLRVEDRHDARLSTGESPLRDPHAWERIVGAFGEYPDLAEWWATGRAMREAERPSE